MKLDKRVIVIEEKLYRVSEDITKLKKAQAYVFEIIGEEFILPYRGKLLKYLKTNDTLKPGIYETKKGSTHIVLPKKKEKVLYQLDNIKDLSNKKILDKTEYIKTDIDLTVNGEIMIPPRHADDDIPNTMLKAGIASKRINFDSYGPRYAALDIGSDQSSRKTNAKKAILNNTTLTATKLIQNCNALDLQFAIVLADKPDAIHPMIYGPLVMYSHEPFNLSSATNLLEVQSKIFDPAAKLKKEK